MAAAAASCPRRASLQVAVSSSCVELEAWVCALRQAAQANCREALVRQQSAVPLTLRPKLPFGACRQGRLPEYAALHQTRPRRQAPRADPPATPLMPGLQTRPRSEAHTCRATEAAPPASWTQQTWLAEAA